MKISKKVFRKVFMLAALLLVVVSMPVSSEAAAVKLNKTKVSLVVGKTAKLTVKGATGKVKWSSSKKSVCTVAQSGKVQAKKKGTAVITAKTGKKTLKCKVTVTEKPALNKKSAKVTVGGTVQLKVTGTAQKVKWSSSDTSICTVSKNGKVKGIKVGGATVKATVGKKTLKCSITVKSPNAKGMQISGPANVLAPTGTMQLSITFKPSNAKASRIKWTTNNNYRATVDTKGLVTAQSNEGSVTITAYSDANNNGYRDSEEIYAEYPIEVKNISMTGSVASADGGDLLLSEDSSEAVFSFAVSDTVADVDVNILDGAGTMVRSYSQGTLGADVETTCKWDLRNNYGAKVSAGSYCFEVKAAGASLKSDYFTVYARSEFAGGNGSARSPYLVANLEQLKLVASHNGVCFRQTANIDVNLRSFTPLFTWDVPFMGTYDGGGYAIQNISTTTSADGIGVFCNIGEKGTVQNLTVENCFFNGKNSIAALTGGNSGIISNCFVKGCSITASAWNSAAIVGRNLGTVKNCESSGNTIVAQDGDAGGVSGLNKGTITGCISKSNNITTSGSHASGGITGNNGGNINSCQVSAVSISSSGYGYAGGVVGYNEASVSNCRVEDLQASGYRCGGIMGRGSATSNVNNTYIGNLDQIGG
ncbi:MAG TPA: hypothetical protein DF613_01370 [Lachnospiraceae bacterium]|nr:hypothetical protein [Lachnospiraceae bacterium]